MASELDRLKARHANAISRFADKNATGPHFEAVTQSAGAVITHLEARIAELETLLTIERKGAAGESERF